MIRSRATGDVVIQGHFGREETETLRAVLQAGALPARIELESERLFEH